MVRGISVEAVVERLPEGQRVETAWASWEQPRELVAARRFALLAAVLALALAVSVQLTRPSPVFVDRASGLRILPRDLVDGAPHGGNSPADLRAALAAGREIAALRFGRYAPETLNPALQAVYARATKHGRAVLDKTLPRRALAEMILGDSGHVAVREFGYGAYVVGQKPGRVILILPLSARYWSVHAPFDGVKSGIPLGDTIELTLVKAAGRWWLDDIKGEVLDSDVYAVWTHYGTTARPRPQVVIEGTVQTHPDSVLIAGYRRGYAYRNQH